jgi:hypothetical protein
LVGAELVLSVLEVMLMNWECPLVVLAWCRIHYCSILPFFWFFLCFSSSW